MSVHWGSWIVYVLVLACGFCGCLAAVNCLRNKICPGGPCCVFSSRPKSRPSESWMRRQFSRASSWRPSSWRPSSMKVPSSLRRHFSRGPEPVRVHYATKEPASVHYSTRGPEPVQYSTRGPEHVQYSTREPELNGYIVGLYSHFQFYIAI